MNINLMGGINSNGNYLSEQPVQSVVQGNGCIEIGQNSQSSGDISMTVERHLIQAIEKANHLQAENTQCEFSIHPGTKQIMIKIIDATTKETVKEIPSEKILDMVANMCELAGIFIDEKR